MSESRIRQRQIISPQQFTVENRASQVRRNLHHLAGLCSEKLRASLEKLDRRDMLALAESREINRVVATALITRLADTDLLVSIASSRAQIFVRRSALQQLDALREEQPLSPSELDRLVPCLGVQELFAYAVALMDACGYDWCARCDASVADVMCSALYAATGIHEEVLVEDAFLQLAHARPDLAGSLRSCSPERFLPPRASAPRSPRAHDARQVHLGRGERRLAGAALPRPPRKTDFTACAARSACRTRNRPRQGGSPCISTREAPSSDR